MSKVLNSAKPNKSHGEGNKGEGGGMYEKDCDDTSKALNSAKPNESH